MENEIAAEPAIKPPKFLVCVDSGAESRVALRLACEKARLRGGMIDIVHVIPPADFQSLFAVADRMQIERRQEAEQLVQKLSEEFCAPCGITPGIVLREGTIGDEIVAAALEDLDASLLVLGVAEHSASRGKLISWLAVQLGAKLFIPLMLVPGNLTDQQLQGLI